MLTTAGGPTSDPEGSALDLSGTLPCPVADAAAARRALARAIAAGALGPGYRVALEGDTVVFDGPRRRGAERGRLTLADDGRVRYALGARAGERARVAEAVALAVAVSTATAMLWSWMFFASLPAGAAVGAGYAVVCLVGDRRRLRRHLAALVASLPVLIDGA